MARYLVTGGGGFIGSHLVHELTRRGEEVRVVDNFITGSRSNLATQLDRIELIEGDLAELDVAQDATRGVDYILHLAAIPSVPRSVADPIASNSSNVNGTLNLLVAARDQGVRRFVYSSSSSVYGNSPILPKHEALPTDPLSPYAVSKLAGEKYSLAFAGVFGIPVVCLRYFNVFGPKQDPTSEYSAVIPKFISCMLRGVAPLIYGDGTQTRDFTYVSNVVQANLLACASKKAVGHVLNAALGVQISLLDLVGHLNQILGTSLSPLFQPGRPGDVKHSCADPRLAYSELGFREFVSFEEGLRRTVEWFRKAKSVEESLLP